MAEMKASALLFCQVTRLAWFGGAYLHSFPCSVGPAEGTFGFLLVCSYLGSQSVAG